MNAKTLQNMQTSFESWKGLKSRLSFQLTTQPGWIQQIIKCIIQSSRLVFSGLDTLWTVKVKYLAKEAIWRRLVLSWQYFPLCSLTLDCRSYLIFVIFFTLALFEAWKFYTQKCMNSWQNRLATKQCITQWVQNYTLSVKLWSECKIT